MNVTLKAGLVTAVLLAASIATPGHAADLNGGGWHRGSVKDGGYAPLPHVSSGAGPCYFRADVGYSISRDPKVKWPVSNGVWTDANVDNIVDAGEVASVFVGDAVTDTSLENTWFGGAGIGCGSGSRGLRAELMFNAHGERKLKGEPLTYDPGPPVTSVGPYTPNPIDDPLHTSIRTYSSMVNVYHDIGRFGSVTPYVGAGVGLAYNKMSEVYFTDNPALTNRIEGEGKLSLAWALMAGIGWQVSDRAVLDVGYRYFDFGKAQSGRVDNLGFVNPRVVVDELAAHEIKVGLRFHVGGGSDCCQAKPLK